MDLKQITKPLYSPKQSSSKLYYKKNVYHKKKLMNSLSSINNKNPRKRNIIGDENFNNFSNIRSYITKEEQYNISNSRASINIIFKTNINQCSYKIITNKYFPNRKSIILIQKFVRGFLAKKKFKHRREMMKLDKYKKRNYLTKNSLNSIHKHINKSSNINILDAIKQNSFRQKNTIKYVNNMLNNNRHSVIEKSKINNRFKNNLFLIPRGNKNYSLDHMKYEDNTDKDYKTYRNNHKNNIFKKPIELIDNKNYNIFLEPDETSFYTSNKRTTSKPVKDVDSIEINFNEKKNENNIEANIELSDLSLSSEQCPQNINKNKNNKNNINEDEVLDSDDEDEKNLNINNEYFENESKNVVNKPEKNCLHNNKNLNNLYNEKSNKYKGIPYIKITSNVSSNPTKENTSFDKIIENEINYGLDSSRNRNSIGTIKAMNDINLDNIKSHKKHKSKSRNKNKEKNKEKNKGKSKDKNKEKIKEDKNKNKDKSKYKEKEKEKDKIKEKNKNKEKEKEKVKVKDKEKEKNDKKKHKKHSKTKSNNNNLNSFKNINFDSKNILNYNKFFPYDINSDNNKQNLLRNMCIGGINNNFLNNKNNIMNESIKEEKHKDTDTNDVKSSFYDHEDFAIISYDYSLNDKKKKLTINNVINIIIKGGINKMKFIKTLESVIRKNIYHYIFKFLKGKFKNDEEDDNEDSSLTINDSCSFIPCKRIEKKNIIFEYAKTDITKKNKVSQNNRKINKQRNLININKK